MGTDDVSSGFAGRSLTSSPGKIFPCARVRSAPLSPPSRTPPRNTPTPPAHVRAHAAAPAPPPREKFAVRSILFRQNFGAKFPRNFGFFPAKPSSSIVVLATCPPPPVRTPRKTRPGPGTVAHVCRGPGCSAHGFAEQPRHTRATILSRNPLRRNGASARRLTQDAPSSKEVCRIPPNASGLRPRLVWGMRQESGRARDTVGKSHYVSLANTHSVLFSASAADGRSRKTAALLAGARSTRSRPKKRRRSPTGSQVFPESRPSLDDSRAVRGPARKPKAVRITGGRPSQPRPAKTPGLHPLNTLSGSPFPSNRIPKTRPADVFSGIRSPPPTHDVAPGHAIYPQGDIHHARQTRHGHPRGLPGPFRPLPHVKTRKSIISANLTPLPPLSTAAF